MIYEEALAPWAGAHLQNLISLVKHQVAFAIMRFSFSARAVMLLGFLQAVLGQGSNISKQALNPQVRRTEQISRNQLKQS